MNLPFVKEICRMITPRICSAANPQRNVEGKVEVFPPDAPGETDTPERSAAERRSEELDRTTAQATPYVRDPNVAAVRRSRFEILLDRALHPRRRKHHRPHEEKPESPHYKSNLDAVMDEYLSVLKEEPEIPSPLDLMPPRSAMTAAALIDGPVMISALLATAATMDGVEWAKARLSAKREAQEREMRLAKRRKYYAHANEKRRSVRATLAAAIPPPENPCPTSDILMDAYQHRHDGEAAAMRFGRLLIDLEEHQRYHVQLQDGMIVGNEGGIRQWLAANCPELAAHYHTCQRFKRRAQDDFVQPEDE